MLKFVGYLAALVAIVLALVSWNPKLLIQPVLVYSKLFPSPLFHSAGMQTFVKLFAMSPKTTSIPQLRSGMATFGKLLYAPQRTRVEQQGANLWLSASDQATRREAVILYFHGGGLCAGSAQDEIGAAAIFAECTGLLVFVT